MGPRGHQAQKLNKINETFTERYISENLGIVGIYGVDHTAIKYP